MRLFTTYYNTGSKRILESPHIVNLSSFLIETIQSTSYESKRSFISKKKNKQIINLSINYLRRGKSPLGFLPWPWWSEWRRGFRTFWVWGLHRRPSWQRSPCRQTRSWSWASCARCSSDLPWTSRGQIRCPRPKENPIHNDECIVISKISPRLDCEFSYYREKGLKKFLDNRSE